MESILLKPHIYRRQIVATGKYYIGKHKGTNKYYRGGGTDYKKDLKIYVTNFNKDVLTEILEYVDDIEYLDKREIYWLKSVDAANNPLYYNKTNKSYGLNRERTKDEKKLIGEKNRSHRKGKKHTEETKQKISQNKRGIKCLGTSQKHKGRISPHCIKVEVYSNNGNYIGTFNSLLQACNTLNVDYVSASRVLRGKLKTTKKYIFKKC